MSLPSLYSLAFSTVHRHIWKNSELPQLVVDSTVNRVYAIKKCNDKQYDKCDEDIIKELRRIHKRLENYPSVLKAKIIAAVSGLNSDIDAFLARMGEGMKKPTEKRLKFSIAHIIWADNNTIDMKATILNIMKNSCLDIEFQYKFLGSQCISRNDVTQARPFHYFETKRRRIVAATDKIDDYIQNIRLVPDYWFEHMRTNDPLYDGSILQYVTQKTQRAAGLEYFYKLAKDNYEMDLQTDPDKELQLTVLDIARASIHNVFCCGEKLMTFHRILTPGNWRIFLEEHFPFVITYLMISWTHRQYCMTFYIEYLDKLSVQMLRTLLLLISNMCSYYEFQYYDIINIVRSMWDITPDALKDDHDITFVLIPKIVLSQADFESLFHFIKQYDVDRQKQVLGLIIFKLYATSREHLVANCLKTVRKLGLDITDPRDLLDRELYKKFLTIEARSETNNYDEIQSLARLLCDTDEQISAVKADLFTDDCFCIELLSGLSHKKDFGKLLDWALEDEQLELFKERLIKRELIHDIYDRRLIENKTIEDADCIFKWLKFTTEELESVKCRVRDNKTVVHMVLLNMIQTDHRLLKIHAKWLLGPDEEAIMNEVLMSDEGLTAISERLANIDYSEYLLEWMQETLDPSDYLEIKFVYDFVNLWLRPYGLIQAIVDRYEAMPLERSTTSEVRRMCDLAGKLIWWTNHSYGDPADRYYLSS